METINTLGKRMGSLETRVGSLESKFDSLETRMEAGFTNLEAKLSAKIDSSIENLAILVKNGFDQMVTKEEFNEKMREIDDRFDRIENISIGGHERRIDNLEDDMRLVKTKVGLRNK